MDPPPSHATPPALMKQKRESTSKLLPACYNSSGDESLFKRLKLTTMIFVIIVGVFLPQTRLKLNLGKVEYLFGIHIQRVGFSQQTNFF